MHTPNPLQFCCNPQLLFTTIGAWFVLAVSRSVAKFAILLVANDANTRSASGATPWVVPFISPAAILATWSPWLNEVVLGVVASITVTVLLL